MAQSLDSLFWTSHDTFHRKLQDDKASTSLLNDHFDWLLYGTQKFKPSNEPSRKQILENLKLEFKGKPFSYNAKLRPLALRAAKLLDLDEVQAMLLLKRWLKNNGVEVERLQENDPAAINDLVLQVLKYYDLERHVLLKSLQVVMIRGAEEGPLSDLRKRLLNANVEEQLHVRLRENVEGGAASITRRLRAGDAAVISGAAGGNAAAAGTSSAVATVTAGFISTAASLDWLKMCKDEMQNQLIRERIELLNCLMLLYEKCGVVCKPDRTLALARLLLDRVFASVHSATPSDGAGSVISSSTSGYSMCFSARSAGAEADMQHSQMLAALLLMSSLDLPGHILLTAAPAGFAAAADVVPPLGGKTMDLHAQISQCAATPATALLLLTWVACLRLLDLSGCGHMIRDLDSATRELETRVASIGGLAAAVAALKTACDGAVGAVLLEYRGVARKALCTLCTAFDLGADHLNPAMYEAVAALVKLCMEDDVQACTDFWEGSVPTMAPLRSLLTGAARLFPVMLHPLLELLRLTAASEFTASRAYAFLQEHVALVVVHSVSERAVRRLGGDEVELTGPLPWNLAPTVQATALPEGNTGILRPMPAVLSALQGRYVMVEYEANFAGNCGQSRGQLLLLSRSVYCVVALEHALLHSLPLEHALLRDLSDTFSLLATFLSLNPDHLWDIIAQSVISSGTARSWMEVAAGVLAIGPQLAAAAAGGLANGPTSRDPTAAAVEAAVPSAPAPPPLQLMADAAKLLGAMAAISPGRVLQLLPQLPLLSSPSGDLLGGLPPSVPMDSLLAFTVPSRIDSFCGLLPVLSAVQRDVEQPTGRYPLTAALLALLAELLERGFITEPLPVVALFVLYELLPNQHHWHYESLKERWTVACGAFRILRLALTAGAFVSDQDLSTLSAPPQLKLSSAPLARGGAAGGSTLLLTYGGSNVTGGGSGVSAQLAAEEAGATLTPDDILQAATPRVHVSVLAAALLKLLLLHGPVLLGRCLPPPAEALEQLQRDDGVAHPELLLLEECAAEVLQLIPPLLAAANVHPQEQPFEEFLFGGPDPTPAAHLASYITYNEMNRDLVPTERQITYLAMRAVLSIAACVSRPVSRSLPGVSLALALPSGSAAEGCLCALLRGDKASAHPVLYAVATQLAADAVANHPELLDALLFPAKLEQQQRDGGDAAAGGADRGRLSVTSTRSPAAPWPWDGRALDGLYATLQIASKLKQDHPQVLACALRVLAAMWRQPAAASRPVSLLRSTPVLWSGLEACLEQVVSSSASAAASPGFPQGQAQQWADSETRGPRALCEAYALQILTAEAFARARFPSTAAAATTDISEVQSMLERLVREGGLLRLLRAAAEPIAAGAGGGGDSDSLASGESGAVGALQATAASLELSLGSRSVSGLWADAGVTEVDEVSIGSALREELAGVRSLSEHGAINREDIQAAYDELRLGAYQVTLGTPGADTAGDAGMQQQQLLPTHPLIQLLQRQCLGAALISRCHVCTTDLAQLPGTPTGPVPGTEQLLSTSRLLILPTAVRPFMVSAVADINAMCSLAEALLARMQAVCTLTSVLAQSGRLLPNGDAASAAAALLEPLGPVGSGSTEPATPVPTLGPAISRNPPPTAATGGGGGGLLTTVQLACWTAVRGLVAWCSSKDSRAALQPDWGLRRLHAQHVAAALSASRLLLSVMQSAQKVLSATPAASSSGGSGVGIFATPRRSLGAGLGTAFATPLGLTPVLTPPRSSRSGGAAGVSGSVAAGGGGSVAADPAYLPFVASLARQLAVWARAVTGGLPQCPPAAAAQITDGLAGALLLALRPLPLEALISREQQQVQAADRQQLATSLLSTLPQLCDLAANGSMSVSLAAQLLLESTRHLAIKDWLPQVFNKLNLGEYILAAAGRAAALATASASSSGSAAVATRGADAAAAAGDLGMLFLALVVAQVPEGAYMLHEQDIIESLVAAGRHLLSGSGGRLAAFSVIAVTGTGPYRPGVDGTYASTAGAAQATAIGGGLFGSPPPDTCGAYLPPASAGAEAGAGLGAVRRATGTADAGKGEIWSPVHRQWCTLLQFSGALVKTLGQRINMERGALDLLLTMEPRLMLAVLPPGGDVLQPLTLAGLVELEAALFLLVQLTAYTGGWHMLLPASLLNFRTAVSTLLTWMAQPTLIKSFSVDCRPRTARELTLAASPAAGIPCSDGWFRVCTLGAAAPATSSVVAGAGPGGSTASINNAMASGGGGGMGSPIFGSISSVGSLSRGLSEVPTTSTPGLVTPVGLGRPTPSLGATGTPGVGGTAANPGAVSCSGVGGLGGVCSEYSAQMAEKLYTCTQHALAFLVASSPQLSQGEAATLGPAWPRPRDLSALLEQCMCVSEALTGVINVAEPPATQERRTQLVLLMGRIGQMCGDFLGVLSAAGAGGGSGGTGGGGVTVREQLAREWLASLPAGPLGAGSSGFGAGLGPHAVPAN